MTRGWSSVRGTEGQRGTVANEIRTGTVLVKHDALLPVELKFESEPCVEGWALVKNLDGRGWDREIQKNGWTSFCFGREVRGSVLGIDGQKMVRRVVRRLLAEATEGFNLLEVTRVASVGPQVFPLVWYVTVSAQPRYISSRLLSLLYPSSGKPTHGEA